jgi:hypothetical protein
MQSLSEEQFLVAVYKAMWAASPQSELAKEDRIRAVVEILWAWDCDLDSSIGYRPLVARLYREMLGVDLPPEMAEEAHKKSRWPPSTTLV